MENHGCIDGNINSSGYSSPVPVIGLYIASASLLCMLLMLCDIVSGFRARKRWLPCKFFTLNSVTLTLLSVAAKLPVDLTTPMPSPRDQLSKLSGTTFICISMAFLIPSLGVNPESESFTNMVALTIFIITVAVNTIIQMSTGVIVIFFVEHIIILCSSFLLLLMMWQSHWDKKKLCSEENKNIFTTGYGSVFQRLKTSCSYGYRGNSQLVASLNHLISVTTTMICTLCCATLIQAAFRSVIQNVLKFCSGHSDYDWSMPVILITQILTVILGNSAVMYRWLTMSKYLKPSFVYPADKKIDDVVHANPVLGVTSRLHKYGRIVRYTFFTTMSFLEYVIGVIPMAANLVVWVIIDNKYDGATSSEWVNRKSQEDVERWIDQSKSEPLNHLPQLLISRNNPYHQFDTMEVIDSAFPDQKGVFASSLSIVLLVRVAQVSLPGSPSRSLVQAFSEVKEVLYYTEKITNPKTLKNDQKLLFAKAVWCGEDFNCLLTETFNSPTNPLPQSDLGRSLSIITHLLGSILPDDILREELVIIVSFINRKTYSTLEELVMSVENLFIDMVRVVLAPLPNAIFKSLNDCTEEEYEENVKLALKITCKMGSIEEYVQWSFPPGCNFTSLTSAEDSPQLDAIQQGVVQSGETDVIIRMENN